MLNIMNSISKTSDRHLFFINFKAGDRDLFENTSIIEDTKDVMVITQNGFLKMMLRYAKLSKNYETGVKNG